MKDTENSRGKLAGTFGPLHKVVTGTPTVLGSGEQCEVDNRCACYTADAIRDLYWERAKWHYKLLVD